MNIVMVCYPTFGGSGVVATELGTALAERGHKVHFVTYKQPVRLSLLNENIYFHQVYVPSYPLFVYEPYELALSSKLVDVIKRHNIDLMHVHYAMPHAYAGYMAKQILEEENIRVPLVTTLHGTDITLVGSHPFYKPSVTFSINHSEVVTCVSESLKQDTLRLFKIKKDILVIPNFIDFAKNQSLEYQPTQMKNNNKRIITHISNFRKVKRIPDVIYTFAKISESINSRLIMVGEGPYRQKAEDLCRKLGIKEKVLFLGNSNEVEKILRLSDLFLLPSETESFGLSALEAMAEYTPVISSNSGGLPEVNIDGVSGYLCKAGDIEALSQKSITILKDQKTLEKFKKQAFNQAKRFGMSRILPLYENLYWKTLEKNKTNV